MSAPNGGGANGHANDWAEHEAYWGQCKLTTILTEPPRHELTLPDGKTIRLSSSHFFDVTRFRIAFIDAIGRFPPLPEKKPGQFLADKFRGWLIVRTTVVVADEASDRGTLLGDIHLATMSCPEADDPRDMDRGAVYIRPDGAAWVSARMLLERVRRGCPVKFSPGDFYAALQFLGAKNLHVQRDGTWIGRAWLLPASMRPEAPELPPATKTPPAAPQAPHEPEFEELDLFGQPLEGDYID